MNEKQKILIADDDPDVVEQLNAVLTGHGCEVATAGSQKDAEEVLMGFQPDLAIIDLMMEKPDSGFVLCHQVQKLYPGTPVILLTAVTAQTGLSFDVHTEEGRAWIKADKIIDKPVRPEQIFAEVNRLTRTPAPAGHGDD